MTASLSGVFNVQQFTDAGLPAANYRLYTYAPGTTTQKVAYTDAAASVPHTYVSDGLGGLYIALNARGELPAPLFLTPGGYDLALKTAAGATIWTRRADGISDGVTALSAAYAAPGGSDLIGFQQSGSGSVARWVEDKLSDTISVKDFGAAGDNATDDSAAITAALAAVGALNSGTGGELWFPPGTYLCASGNIAIPNNVTLRGAGQRASLVKFTSVSGGFTSINPINSSTNALVSIDSMGIYASNAGNTGIGFLQVGGHFVTLKNVFVYGFKYNVVFNQTEVSVLEDCFLENAITAELWLVNGGDMAAYPTASQGYTNRISVVRTAFDARSTAYCVIDDGGVAHTYEDCNYNGGLQHMRCAGQGEATISGGEFELAVGPCITFQDTTLLGTSVGQSSGILIQANAFLPAAAQNCIQYIAAASTIHLSNSFGASSAAPSIAITNLTHLLSLGNRDYNRISGTAAFMKVMDAFSSVQTVFTGTALVMSEINVAYSGSMTIDAQTGNTFVISVNNASTMTINAPTNPKAGQRFCLVVRNISGGAMGVITWNAVFKMSAWTNPGNGFSRSLDFEYNGTVWRQVGQTGVDVPN